MLRMLVDVFGVVLMIALITTESVFSGGSRGPQTQLNSSLRFFFFTNFGPRLGGLPELIFKK
jgi:hypothetical protein